MPKVREAKGDEAAEVDMTPMIDVTFLLIIFFVTIQQLTVQEVAVKVTLPRARQANPETSAEKDRLIVTIDESGAFHVGPFNNLSLNEVSDHLSREAGPDGANTATRDAEGFAKRNIFVRADMTAPYGSVQDVMAECRKYKLWKLQFRVRQWKKK